MSLGRDPPHLKLHDSRNASSADDERSEHPVPRFVEEGARPLLTPVITWGVIFEGLMPRNGKNRVTLLKTGKMALLGRLDEPLV